MFSIILNIAIVTANTLVGTKENPAKSNTGFVIDKIQKYFGLIGQQYCVMTVLYCYLEACNQLKIKFPFPLTASSQTLYEDAKKLNCVFTNPSQIKAGDIVIWRKFNLWKGHAGLIISQLSKDNTFITIEGNTSNSDFGSQSDGDGIYKRIRTANKLEFTYDNFYIRGFIDVKKYFEVKGNNKCFN
jgi:hypothetical protein